MPPYRQVLTRMRLGDSDRRIARDGLMERHRIAALRRMAESAGWLDLRSPLPEDSAVLAAFQVRRSSGADAKAASTADPTATSTAAVMAVSPAAGQAPDEAWYRNAIEADRRSGNRLQCVRHLVALASLLRGQVARLDEARHLAEAAVSIGQTGDPAAPELWQAYGVLAEILTRYAATDADPQRRAELLARAGAFQQLGHFTPRFLSALTQLNVGASYARAVISARLARSFYMSGHNAEAIARLSQALTLLEALTPGDGVNALRGTLNSELGEILLATRQHERARQAFTTALATAEALQDVRAQAVSLSQLAALSLAERRAEDALERSQKALSLFQRIHEPEVEAAAWDQLGAIFHELREDEQAEWHHQEAARLRAQFGGDGSYRDHNDCLSTDQHRAQTSLPPAELPFQITVEEERLTEYGLDGDLLIDGPRELTVSTWSGTPQPLSATACPMLAPCVRVSCDTEGAIRFSLPFGEPQFEQHDGCTVIRRQRRQIRMSGAVTILWSLIEAADGTRNVVRLLAEVPPRDRAVAAHALGILAATSVMDVSGRPIGRFVHSATKKGVFPAGGLEDDEVLRLVTESDHRVYPGASRIALSRSVPERLRDLYSVTRTRRSPRAFDGRVVSRGDFDALLHTACGTTGALSWAGREVKLRAYPSSGGLYAVEVYAIVLQVEELAAGLYHYRADENSVEQMKRDFDRNRLLQSILPTEREMVAGVSAMFVLTGRFRRHEKKYGEGGYRMLVAEAGHISQSLVLTAVALGLSARPFGGVFDALFNRDLGLEDDDEQFLLSVLVGQAPVRADTRS